MTDPIISALIAVLIMLLVGFPVHEFMHAWTAYRLGDNTARWQGRLTLDPRVHFDPMGGTLLVVSMAFSSLQGGFFAFGWARPTPVNPLNLQGGRRGEALVAAAGPLSNLVMAAAAALPLRYIIGSPELGRAIVDSEVLQLAFDVGVAFLTLNILLFLFNLIPIPPLDGWRVLLGLAPRQLAYQLREFEARYASIIPIVFLAFLFLGGFRIISPLLLGLRDLLLGI
ncbi:site-2 protease family protein [soil metagenome]